MNAPPLLAALLLAGCSAAPPVPVEPESTGPGGSMPSADLLARYDDPDKERKLVAIAESTRESSLELLDPNRHPRGTAPEDHWEREEPPPAAVREAAETFLTSRLGRAARGLVTPNTSVHLSADAFCSEWGTDICGHYGHSEVWRLSYHFQVRDHARDVRLVFLSDGTHVTYDVPGIPDCVGRSSECVFPISESDAFSIAREAGLGPGVGEWSIELAWHRTYLWPHGGSARQPLVFGTYAWSVANATSDDAGDLAYVDANSGIVLLRDQWSRTVIG